MFRCFAIVLGPALLTASCTATDIEEPTGSTPSETEDARPRRGVASVRTPTGIERVHYQEMGGRAVAEGDIDLGPIEKFALRANILVDTSARWPNATVPYTIDPAIPGGDPRRTHIADAIAHIEEMTPVSFVPLPDDICANQSEDCTDYIWFTDYAPSDNIGLAELGYAPGRRYVRLGGSLGLRTHIHEIGHALGLSHEQKRPDRDNYVIINWDCIDTGDEVDDDADEIDWSKQYILSPPGSDFAEYDFASIMHYTSNTGRDEDWQAAPCNGGLPMRRRPEVACSVCTDHDNDGVFDYIPSSAANLSARDVNALWGMYRDELGVSEAGDRFGAAIASADFDGDGYLDVAIGAPGEDIGDTADAGAVFVYKGTGEGFQPWVTITQGWLGAVSETGDELGASLTTGDFDDDGHVDLAIGAPGELHGVLSDTGAVFIARGGASGLSPAQTIVQATVGDVQEADDRFGFALAAGDLTGDGVDDLAVGAPGERPGNSARAGRVFVLRGVAGGNLVHWDTIGQEEPMAVGDGGIAPPPLPLGTPADNDQFGWSLAIGRLDPDAMADLVVGAMCDSDDVACGGAVYTFRGAASSLRGWRRLARPAPAFWERSGWSVAILDIDADGDRDVASGAPHATSGGAAGAGLVGFWATAGASMPYAGTLAQSGFAASEVGDRFGTALASVPSASFFYPAQLIVGVPQEGVDGDNLTAGVVQRFRVQAGALVHQALIREAPAGLEEEEDDFGAAVAAVARIDGTWIFSGTPGENGASGAVYVSRASGAIAQPSHYQTLTQLTDGTHAP